MNVPSRKILLWTAMHKGVFVLCAAVVLAILFSQRSTVMHTLNAWKVLPRPERLTELYFTDYRHLPTTLKPGTPMPVAFTVQNTERRTTHYSYVVLANTERGSKQLSEGSFTVADTAVRNERLAVSVLSPLPRAEIVVHLRYDGVAPGNDRATPQAQDIHFWVNNTQ